MNKNSSHSTNYLQQIIDFYNNTSVNIQERIDRLSSNLMEMGENPSSIIERKQSFSQDFFFQKMSRNKGSFWFFCDDDNGIVGWIFPKLELYDINNEKTISFLFDLTDLPQLFKPQSSIQLVKPAEMYLDPSKHWRLRFKGILEVNGQIPANLNNNTHLVATNSSNKLLPNQCTTELNEIESLRVNLANSLKKNQDLEKCLMTEKEKNQKLENKLSKQQEEKYIDQKMLDLLTIFRSKGAEYIGLFQVFATLYEFLASESEINLTTKSGDILRNDVQDIESFKKVDKLVESYNKGDSEAFRHYCDEAFWSEGIIFEKAKFSEGNCWIFSEEEDVHWLFPKINTEHLSDTLLNSDDIFTKEKNSSLNISRLIKPAQIIKHSVDHIWKLYKPGILAVSL
jgi:hypothetical protein